jgi:transglutaminase-like putative cysteine protease
MSIHVALHHVTHYRYDRLIHLGPQVIRLRPAPHCRTRILSYSLRVLPPKHFINWQQDPQANYLARLVFPDATREFRVEVDLVAEMAVINPFDFFLEPDAEYYPLEQQRGVCQDFTHFMISCLRSTGLAARYVSGYVLTRPGPARQRPAGAEASHAWVSLLVPGAGWIELDPTNNVMPSWEHITLGWGRDFSDVTPLRGVINGGGKQTIEVTVTVEPLGNQKG